MEYLQRVEAGAREIESLADALAVSEQQQFVRDVASRAEEMLKLRAVWLSERKASRLA